MYPYDDMPGGANQAFRPRPTQFGGNSSGMAGINSMVSALSGIQDRYNQQKAMRRPGQPMVDGQPWQPAPREGSPNLFQGAPNMGPQSGMPSAPPSAVMPPTQPPMMPSAPPVPFQGMNGPGMGMGNGAPPALTSLMSNPPTSGAGAVQSMFSNAGNPGLTGADAFRTMLANPMSDNKNPFSGMFG